MKVDENLFNLSIETNTEGDEDNQYLKEKFCLFFTHENNEMVLVEDTCYGTKESFDIQNEKVVEGGLVKERTYMLKVVDKETKSTMYYDVKLARVEIEKDNDSLSEHLEVIAKLDDENPFDTEFDDPEDLKKIDK